MPDPVEQDLPEDMLYEDIIHENEGGSVGSHFPAIKMSLNAKPSNNKRQPQFKKPDETVMSTDETELDITALPHKDILPMPIQDKFPHGPRTFEDPVVAAPRSMKSDFELPETSTENQSRDNELKTENISTSQQDSKPIAKRKRRSVVVSDRKARSADVGVSGLYEVISEADLAFSPDSRAEAVTVFQGRIREEVVYGICMPVPGFSLLFVLVAVSAVVSALVAGSLLYRYQLQKEHLAERSQHQNGTIPLSMFSSWMGLRLLRMRGSAAPPVRTTQQNGKAGDNSLALNGKASETRSAE
ncbi:hypothetical protein NQ314_016135 [Rhamnusium bicolor]|uniref:Uncharacterized protein n=1 Tax=Rhamnusium bicolor TaxID=1586634 RepID=A0AAV8WWG2_9CUCU|nr:hypothetical protein NQ314_016135 [Rhamnusium bicolor]